jgi:hypothetical protein
LLQKYRNKSVLLKNCHNKLNFYYFKTFLYICGLILNVINMKRIITLSFALAMAITSFAQGASPVMASIATQPQLDPKTGIIIAPTPPITKPAAILEDVLALKETMFNFGKIPQGKPVTHIFTVTNTGKTGFKLDNVQASCGCTTPQWNKDQVVEPGKSAEITVGYNAAAAGAFNKSITITYNGGQSKVLNIAGEVWTTPAASAPANEGANDLKN